MPIARFQMPDGRVARFEVPDGTTPEQAQRLMEQASAELGASPSGTGYIGPRDFAAERQRPENDPTEGMSGPALFAAGLGKSVYDVGRGVGQLAGQVSFEDVQRARELDAPLMRTGSGKAGAMTGAIGMALSPGVALKGAGALTRSPGLYAAGQSFMVPRTVLGGAGVGAAVGAMQPGASMGEKIANVGIGGVGGAAYPALSRVGASARAATEPFYEAGQRRIVGTALRRASEGGTDDVLRALESAQTLVPGAPPTVGQVVATTPGGAGVAALERAASAIDQPVLNAYSTRMRQQNAARAAAVSGIAQDDSAMAAAVSAREEAARPLYDIAKGKTVQADDALKSIMGRMPRGVLERAKDLARMRGEEIQIGKDVPAQVLFVGGGIKQVPGAHGSSKSVQTPGLLDASGRPMTRESEAQFSKWTGKGLHYIKMALDDAIADPQAGFVGQQRSAALSVKDDLLGWLDNSIPEYGQASAAYAAGSKPINQMDIGMDLAQKSSALTGKIQPENFSRALRSGDQTARKATGFKGATLEGTMTPEQMRTLTSVREDLARASAAQTEGRGVGSDTVQKLAYANLIESAGVPTFLRQMAVPQAFGNVLARLGDGIYGRANREVANRLALTLLDPAEAAAAMRLAQPHRNGLSSLMRNTATPLGVVSPAIVNTSQQ